MVTDFKNLECIKVLVDDILDHKFIMDISDPLFDSLFNNSSGSVIWDEYGIGRIDESHIDAELKKLSLNEEDEDRYQAEKDKLEGLVVVDFVPTSENLCRMFATVAKTRLKSLFGERVRVAYVDFWETPKSHCRFTP